MKKKGHVDPTLKKIKIKIKNKKNKTKGKEKETGAGRGFLFFIFIFFLSHFSLRFTEVGPSEFVGGRSKVLYSMRATRMNQKHEI